MKTNIQFISKGIRLSGTIIAPKVLKAKNPGVIFLHGLTGGKEKGYQYAEGLAKLGYISFLFDMRGHGQSTGDINTATINEFMQDCLSAYDFFIKIKGVDRNNISVVGNSLGGHLGVLLASKRKVRNLAMRVPADYPTDVFDKPTMDNGAENPRITKWRKQPKKYNESPALKAMHNFKGDVLVIQAETDMWVPHTTVENYVNAVSNKSKLTNVTIKGMSHSVSKGGFRDKVEKVIVDWFSKNTTK